MTCFGFFLSTSIGIICFYNFFILYRGAESFDNLSIIFSICYVVGSIINSALLLALFLLQLYLIGKNLTTKEYLGKKYVSLDNPNPFDEGCFNNFKFFWKRNLYKKQITMDYLIKKKNLDGKSKNSSEVEIGNNCNLFGSKIVQQQEIKIQENLLEA